MISCSYFLGANKTVEADAIAEMAQNTSIPAKTAPDANTETTADDKTSSTAIGAVEAAEGVPFERNGEGVCYTGNYFYAYYVNNEGVAIPFVQINLNEEQSQNILNTIKNDRKRTGIKRYINTAIDRARSNRSENSISNSNDNRMSYSTGNDRLDSNILRKGRYFDSPSLYVKGKRTDRALYREEVADGTTSDSTQSMEAHARGLAEKLGLENVEVVVDIVWKLQIKRIPAQMVLSQ